MSRASTKAQRRLPAFPICSQGREGCAHFGFHGGCGPRSPDERRRVACWWTACALADFGEPDRTTNERYFRIYDEAERLSAELGAENTTRR